MQPPWGFPKNDFFGGLKYLNPGGGLHGRWLKNYWSKTCSNRSGLSIAPTPDRFGHVHGIEKRWITYPTQHSLRKRTYAGRHIRRDHGIEDADTIDSLIRLCEHVKSQIITLRTTPKAEKIKQVKIKLPNPMKGRMKVHTSGSQRLKARKLHRESPKSNFAPPYQISRWKKNRRQIFWNARFRSFGRRIGRTYCI